MNEDKGVKEECNLAVSVRSRSFEDRFAGDIF